MLPRLPELFVGPDAAQALRGDAAKLPVWEMTSAQRLELALLAGGGCFPLRGYMTAADHAAVLAGMRLASGALWPRVVALAVDAEFAAGIAPGEDIALRAEGEVRAILSVTDLWPDRDGALLGGRVKVLAAPEAAQTPNALRARFRHAARVIAEPHALGLWLRPDGGEAVWLALPPCAGPRDLLWQALLARNHGATHFRLPDAGAELLEAHRDEVGLVLVAA